MWEHTEELRREVSGKKNHFCQHFVLPTFRTEEVNYCCFSAQCVVICYGSYGKVRQCAQFQSSCLEMLRQSKGPIIKYYKCLTLYHQSSGTRQNQSVSLCYSTSTFLDKMQTRSEFYEIIFKLLECQKVAHTYFSYIETRQWLACFLVKSHGWHHVRLLRLMVFWFPESLLSSTSLGLPSTANAACLTDSDRFPFMAAAVLGSHTTVLTSQTFWVSTATGMCFQQQPLLDSSGTLTLLCGTYQASTSLHGPFNPGTSTSPEVAPMPMSSPGLSWCQISADLHNPFMPSKPVPHG